jgi:phosphate transport system permease protein
VPSIVYGLWGLFFLQGHVIGVSRWISTWFSWIPLFHVEGADPNNPLASQSVYTASTFIAGLVVALMVVPISCSIMREVFSQAPAGEREGAYALGATRFEAISAALYYARTGIVGSIMLGFGRALGETMAVTMVIGNNPQLSMSLFAPQYTMSAVIANEFTEAADELYLHALIEIGLVLFIITLIVNLLSRLLIWSMKPHRQKAMRAAPIAAEPASA